MDWMLFGKWYAVGCIPIALLAFINIRDRIKFKKYGSVRVWLGINTVCILSLFVSLLGWLANYLDGADEGDSWFVPMMLTCYLLMIFLCMQMFSERIIYNKTDGNIICYHNFKKKQLNVNEITRFNFSNEHIDLYIKDKRIRCTSLFFVGTGEFEEYLKDYFKQRKSK